MRIIKSGLVSHKRLLELVRYDPKTGVFTSRVSVAKYPAGRVMGCLHHTGYIYIGIDGRDYGASRLAWFYVTGVWPSYIVDHRNRKRSDNRWSNLREAADGQNRANSRAAGASGMKGVRWRVRNGKGIWVAQITAGRKVMHLGHFRSKAAARRAYVAAAKLHHKEFARV